MKTIIKSFLVIMFFTLSMPALQAQQIKELRAFFSEQNINSEDRIYQMVYGLVPTIVISNNQKSYSGELEPQKLEIEAKSLSAINDGDKNYGKVKMIQIHITEQSEKSSVSLSPSVLNTFPELEFVYILSDVLITTEEVSRMVSGLVNTNILVLYLVSIPE